MSSEDILDRQIEDYLHNRMDAETRKQFETSLNNNSILRKSINDLVTLKLLYNNELFELKRKLDAAENELKAENFFDENKES